MTNFYDNAYWEASLDERLARAREEYRRAKERLLRTQIDLADIPPTRSYIFEGASQVAGTAGVFGPPIKTDAIEALFGTDPERKRLWDRYLKDFEWYVRKKVEYDRLFAETARQRMMNPENRPSQTPTAPGPAPAVRPAAEPAGTIPPGGRALPAVQPVPARPAWPVRQPGPAVPPTTAIPRWPWGA